MPSSRILLAMGALFLSEAAQAADIDILDAPEIGTIARGTGWYVRGDLAYGFDATFGGTQELAAPFGTVSDRFGEIRLDEGFGAGGGIGYKATDWLRFDATADYWKRNVEAVNGSGWFCGFSSLCATRDAGKIEAVELLANVYADLGTVAGFTPYVGAGLGAVYVNYSDVASTATCPSGTSACSALGAAARYIGEDSWRFAYALSAGVSYDVTDRIAIDTGYHYLQVTDGDSYRFEPAAGTRLASEDDGFDRHTIRAGLRFRFD
ncbi:outer membrane beta-barrel protein [Aureimonas sp. ME7]|uniref:outer membrane protein n=1 Tax=Aureimonas sp. ME7 TaxID=2744252 RepID=UPI0015F70CB3|nr:outer membrane beta-barrel protein [Aureimonas sp. ME7]